MAEIVDYDEYKKERETAPQTQLRYNRIIEREIEENNMIAEQYLHVNILEFLDELDNKPND